MQIILLSFGLLEAVFGLVLLFNTSRVNKHVSAITKSAEAIANGKLTQKIERPMKGKHSIIALLLNQLTINRSNIFRSMQSNNSIFN